MTESENVTPQDTPVIESWEVPASLRSLSPYLKRLLIDRHYIRARIDNPGGSVIMGAAQRVELEATNQYSTVLGNDYHLDLLEAEKTLSELPGDEQFRLLRWCDSLPPQIAAEFAQKIVARRPGPRKRRADGVALRMIGILNPERLHRVEVDEIPLSAIVVD